MSDNKQSQQTEQKMQTSISRKKILKQIEVYGSLLEGKRHQADKIKFLNEPKQTELAKQKHDVSTMHNNICVTFDMSFATPQSNSAALLFSKKLF